MSANATALDSGSRTYEKTSPLRIVSATEIPPASKQFEQKILSLHQSIEALVQVEGGKVVCITGLQQSAQGFTYLHELARLASKQLGKRVLVLTTAGGGFSERLAKSTPRGWEKMLFASDSARDLLQTLADPSVEVSQLNESPDSLAKITTSASFKAALDRLRLEYDLILVDTPALLSGMDAELVAPVTDGIILIVDAGASRWQVVRHVVEGLTARQATVLGVVLNKRRHYIPSFIYRKL